MVSVIPVDGQWEEFGVLSVRDEQEAEQDRERGTVVLSKIRLTGATHFLRDAERQPGHCLSIDTFTEAFRQPSGVRATGVLNLVERPALLQRGTRQQQRQVTSLVIREEVQVQFDDRLSSTPLSHRTVGGG